MWEWIFRLYWIGIVLNWINDNWKAIVFFVIFIIYCYLMICFVVQTSIIAHKIIKKENEKSKEIKLLEDSNEKNKLKKN